MVNCDLFVSLHQIIGMLEVKDAKIAVGGQTLAAGLSFMARDGQLTRPLTVKTLEEVLNDVYSSRESRMFAFLKTLKEEAEGEANE